MSTKNIYIGPNVRLTYDDADFYKDDGTPARAIRVDGSIRIDAAPVYQTDAVRLQELQSWGGVAPILVANIDDPSAELAAYDYNTLAPYIRVYENATGDATDNGYDQSTLYKWSSYTTGMTASAPHIVAGSGGFWIAIGGYAFSGILAKFRNNVTIGGLTTTGLLYVTDETVLNSGGGDNDTRISGQNDDNLFYADASADKVGVGIATPEAKLHVVSAAAGLVSRMQATVAGNDPTSDILLFRANTTDGTAAVNVATIPIGAGSGVYIHATITAAWTAGTGGAAGDCAAYELKGLFSRLFDLPILVGSEAKTVIAESQADWDVEFLTAGLGANVGIGVTGAADNTVSWNVVVHRIIIV